jgi:hypothetical protein
LFVDTGDPTMIKILRTNWLRTSLKRKNKIKLLSLLKGLSKRGWGLSKVDIQMQMETFEEILFWELSKLTLKWKHSEKCVLRVVKVDIEMETFRKMCFESCQSWVWNGEKTTFMEVIVFWDQSLIPKISLQFSLKGLIKQIWHRNWEQLADFIQCWVEQVRLEIWISSAQILEQMMSK